MSHSSLLIEKRGTTLLVGINRVERRNAVDRATAQQLYEASLAFDRDVDLGVAILYGVGGAFCAGADLKAFAASKGYADDTANASVQGAHDGGVNSLGPMGPTRLVLGKPVIAAIEGNAVAGGLELALWADLRIVGEGAVFGVYCRRFGVPLVDLGTVRLPRLIGHSRAMDLILTGRPVDADEAYQIGLANRVVPKGAALDHAMAMAQQLAKFPQACLRNDRRSALAQWGLDEDAALRQEWQGGVAVVKSGETLEGAQRFSAGQGRHGRF